MTETWKRRLLIGIPVATLIATIGGAAYIEGNQTARGIEGATPDKRIVYPTLTPMPTLESQIQAAQAASETIEPSRTPDATLIATEVSASPTEETQPVSATPDFPPTLEPQPDLPEDQVSAALDTYFGVNPLKDEGDSLMRLTGAFTPDMFSQITKIKEAMRIWGKKSVEKYVLARAPIYGMIWKSVEGVPGTTVYMGLDNPNFNILDEKKNSLGFEKVGDPMTLNEIAQSFGEYATFDDDGHILFWNPDVNSNEPGTGSVMAVESSDGKDRLMFGNLDGYEAMVAAYHLQITWIAKTLDKNQSLTSDQIHQIVKQVVDKILARHFTFKKEKFPITRQREDGSQEVIVEYSYPDQTCAVQDAPAFGGDPENQRLMALKGPIRDQGSNQVEYGTIQEGVQGKYATPLVSDTQKMRVEWDGDAGSMAEVIEGNIQTIPVVYEEDGEKDIPGDYEISPTTETEPDNERTEKAFILCTTIEGHTIVATATQMLIATPGGDVITIGPTPKPGETQIPPTEIVVTQPAATITPEIAPTNVDIFPTATPGIPQVEPTATDIP